MKKNVLVRSLTGLFFVLALVFCVEWNSWTTAGLFFIFMLLGQRELLSMLAKTQVRPVKAGVYILSILLYLYVCIRVMPDTDEGALFFVFRTESDLILLLFAFCSVFVFVSELYRNKPNPLENIAAAFFSVAYVALPFALLNYLRNPFFEKGSPEVLMGFFIFIWVNDTFAYVFGILLGKHRLFERLSPKKSWEGAIGGGLMTLLAAYIWALYYLVFPLWIWILFALLVVVFGIFGDLAESMFKRSLNIKDSGNILPGHGGILDRFDSVLLAVPIVSGLLIYYVFCSFFI